MAHSVQTKTSNWLHSLGRSWQAASLRSKTKLIIAAALVGMLLLALVPLRIFVLQSFAELERREASLDAERTLNALNNLFAELERVTNDYAAWDDTYVYVNDRNQQYIDLNFADTTFINNRLSFVLISDNSNQIRFARHLDLAAERAAPPEFQSLVAALNAGDPLNGVTGLWMAENMPYLVVARPILPSSQAGPPRGTLVMGRALDADFTTQLVALTRLDLIFFRLDGPTIPADVAAARDVLLVSDQSTYTAPLSQARIATYALLRDLDQRPSIILRTTLPRTIYSYGETMVTYSMLAILGTIIALGSLMLFLLQRAVLDRQARLDAQVQQIGATGDLSGRVGEHGADEIGRLSRSINSMLASIENATRQRQYAEAALFSLVDSSPLAIVAFNAAGIITAWNPAAAELFGWQADETLEHEFPADRANTRAELHRLQAIVRGGATIKSHALSLYHKNGAPVDVSISLAPLGHEPHLTAGVVAVIADITAAKRANDALSAAYAHQQELAAQLQRSRDALRTLFDGLGDGLALLDAGGVVLAINRGMAALLAGEPLHLVGRPWNEIIAEHGADAAALAVDTTFRESEYQRKRAICALSGERRHVLDIQTLPLTSAQNELEQLILHVVDVTAQVQLETIAREAERFAANGRLVAALAHELNTPLQSIVSCIELARLNSDGRRDLYLTLANEEIRRVSRIVRGLLDLHRPISEMTTAIDINALIERVLLLTGHSLAEHGIVVERDLTPRLPVLHTRADQLTQVLINLILNAIDAMPDGGMLICRTGLHNDPPGWIVITMADSGLGMPPDTLARIFEPFFTTKSSGTGLGLTIIRQIITQVGGVIEVQSEQGAGTAFTVKLPLQDTLDMELEND